MYGNPQKSLGKKSQFITTDLKLVTKFEKIYPKTALGELSIIRIPIYSVDTFRELKSIDDCVNLCWNRMR